MDQFGVFSMSKFGSDFTIVSHDSRMTSSCLWNDGNIFHFLGCLSAPKESASIGLFTRTRRARSAALKGTSRGILVNGDIL